MSNLILPLLYPWAYKTGSCLWPSHGVYHSSFHHRSDFIIIIIIIIINASNNEDPISWTQTQVVISNLMNDNNIIQKNWTKTKKNTNGSNYHLLNRTKHTHVKETIGFSRRIFSTQQTFFAHKKKNTDSRFNSLIHTTTNNQRQLSTFFQLPHPNSQWIPKTFPLPPTK